MPKEEVTIKPPEPKPSADIAQKTREVKRLFRRKPLLVEATANPDQSWTVKEAGRVLTVAKEEFNLLYDIVEVDETSSIDAGLPDLEPGTEIEKGGRRLLRVVVIAGRGQIAYWWKNKPKGADCEWKVIADMVVSDLPHYAGKFVEAFEGKPGARTWIEIGK